MEIREITIIAKSIGSGLNKEWEIEAKMETKFRDENGERYMAFDAEEDVTINISHRIPKVLRELGID